MFTSKRVAGCEDLDALSMKDLKQLADDRKIGKEVLRERMGLAKGERADKAKMCLALRDALAEQATDQEREKYGECSAALVALTVPELRMLAKKKKVEDVSKLRTKNALCAAIRGTAGGAEQLAVAEAAAERRVETALAQVEAKEHLHDAEGRLEAALAEVRKLREDVDTLDRRMDRIVSAVEASVQASEEQVRIAKRGGVSDEVAAARLDRLLREEDMAPLGWEELSDEDDGVPAVFAEESLTHV